MTTETKDHTEAAQASEQPESADALPASAPAPEPAEAKQTDDTAKAQQDHCLGIDLGSDTAVVALISTQTLKTEIVRNDISNQTTSVAVAFSGRERLFGDGAKQQAGTNSKNTVLNLLAKIASGEPTSVYYDGKDRSLAPEQLLGMFFARLRSFGEYKLEGKPCTNCCVVLPECFTAEQRAAVRAAAKVGGLSAVRLITRSSASALTYGTKRSAEACGAGGRKVLFVDVGSGYVTLSVWSWDGKKGSLLASKCNPSLGASAVDDLLYSALKERCATEHKVEVADGTRGSMRLRTATLKLKKTLSAVPEGAVTVENLGDGMDVRLSMSRGQLEERCAPLAALLATELAAVVEEAKAADAEQRRLARAAAAAEGEGEGEGTPAEDDFVIDSVELIGGGMRVPWVQRVVGEAVGGADKLSFTLDSMSAGAMGAAFAVARLYEPKGALRRPVFDTVAGIADAPDSGIFGACDAEAEGEALAGWVAQEAAMLETDLELAAIAASRLVCICAGSVGSAHECTEPIHGSTCKRTESPSFTEARNELEAYLYEMRAVCGGGRQHAELVKKAEAAPFLDACEEWLYNDEPGCGAHPAATRGSYMQRLAQLKAELDPSCQSGGAYFTMVESAKRERERELEEAAARAKAEAEANGDDKQDHDFRKLKKPDRMRKLMLNKDEGTTLFKDGNYEAASLRYTRALQHSEKFFDLNAEDEQEVEKLKLSLYLNMAQCAIKQEQWEVAIEKCRLALIIDGASCKALYRRALALERTKEFEAAKKDLAKAAKISPDDKAVAKLQQRVAAQIKCQKAQQAKMARKMFG